MLCCKKCQCRTTDERSKSRAELARAMPCKEEEGEANGRRGWVQSAEIGQRHRQEVGDALVGILRGMDKFSWKSFEMEVRKRGYDIHILQGEDGKVYGYSIMRGNSRYKASELGRGRNLTASKIEGTWAKLHPQERKSPSSKTIIPKTGSAVRQSSPQRQ